MQHPRKTAHPNAADPGDAPPRPRAARRGGALAVVAALVTAFILIGATSSWLTLSFVRRAEEPTLPEGFPRALDLEGKPEAYRENFQPAWEAARQALSGDELDEEDARKVAGLANIFLANGHIDQSIWCYLAAADIDPENPLWPHSLGYAYHQRGQVREALAQFERSASLAPDSVAAHMRLGQTFQSLGEPDHARAQYERVLELEPDNAWALLGLARIEFEAGDFDSARERLDVVVEAEPRLVPARRLLARIEWMQDDRREALERIMKTSVGLMASDFVDPWAEDIRFFCFEPALLLTRALAAFQQGDAGAQRKLFMRMMDLDSDNPNLHIELAGVFTDQGQTLDALAAFERALETNPDSEEALIGYAHALRDARRPVAVFMEALEDAREVAPDSPEPLIDLAHFNVLEQNAEEAEKDAREALELDPRYGRAYNILGNALKMQDRYGEALACYLQASRLYVDLKGMLNTRADTLRVMDRLDEAEALLNRSMMVQPRYADTWYGLCNVADAKGEKQKASYYRKVTDMLMNEDKAP